MNRLPSNILLVISVVVVSVSWSGCGLLGLDGSGGRIVLGQSIEGVAFGDSEEEVISRIGVPDDTQAADLAGNRFLYVSDDGRLQLEFTISKDSAVGLGVVAMSAYPAYEGHTASGIGPGSPRSRVIEILGQPDETRGRYDTYVLENSRVTLEYREAEVHRLSMNIT